MSDHDLTLDQAMAKAAEAFDEVIQQSLDEYEVFLKDQGAFEKEIAAQISRYQSDLAAWRKERLEKRLRSWLERGGEELH